MRKPCLNCVIKHLAQAYVLKLESEQSYPLHIFLVYGHLAEASEEVYGISIELAEEIRQYRLMLMDDNKFEIPFFELYEKVIELIKKQGCGDCQKSSDDFKKKLEEKLKNSSKVS